MENTISKIIEELHEAYRDCDEGELADYIPELTRANPDWFGISVFTTDGHCYSYGDTDQAFTIQSISKAFTYGLILDEFGSGEVDQRIGVEPSGEAFNSISLDPVTGRPFNPMINAGAITATGMVRGTGLDDRFERVRRHFSKCAGADLDVDEDVYRSESATGFRNRAIANLLRNFEMLDDPVDEAVEVYFKQCSILVTCQNLALMAGSLANDGVNPVTGKRVVKHENLEKVLSVMSTCGMYDYSGEWIFNVGLPAKSGVGGGVVGVLPGQLGVAVFSPRLDAKGNSVRGVRIFSELSKRFNLHLFNAPVVANQSIRRVYRLSEVGSNRQRPQSDYELIRKNGDRAIVVEMQGDLFFSSFERLLRAQTEHAAEIDTYIVDLTRVGLIDRATEDLFCQVAGDLAAQGKVLSIIDPERLLDFSNFAELEGFFATDDIQVALERCEMAVLRGAKPESESATRLSIDRLEWFNSLSSDELSTIEDSLKTETFEKGATIIRQGDDPDSIYLLASGLVSIYHNSNDEKASTKRLIGFSPGVVFGEMAAIDGRPRSADVVADKDSVCYTFPLEALKKLESDHPAIHAKLMRSILLLNIDRLKRSNAEIASLKA